VIGPRQTGADVGGLGSDARGRIAVGLSEHVPVAPVREAPQRELAGLGLGLTRLTELRLHQLEAAEPREHVRPPRAVVVARAHRVAVLAVIDQVDPYLALAPDNVGDGLGQLLLIALLVHLAALTSQAVQFHEILRPGQASGMAGLHSTRQNSPPRTADCGREVIGA
jgi:hypothetical protein